MEANQRASSPSVPPSRTSQSTEIDASKQKLPCTVDLGNNLVGTNYAKFMTRAGEFVRSRIPLKYKDWRHVPKKDDVWNALMGEFELNVDPNLARPGIEKTFPSKFRSGKNSLRRNILRKPGQTKDGAISACTIGYNPTVWKEFVIKEMKPDVIEACVKNSVNKKKNPISHNLGRCTYYNKSYIVEGTNEKVVPEDRADRWLRAHEKKDGTVNPSAIEQYNKVKTAQQKRKMMGGGSSSQVDLDSDALTDVFGLDIKGGVRGHASHVSKKRAQQALVAASIFNKRVVPLRQSMNEMRNEMGQLSNTLKTVVQQLQYVAPPQQVEGDGSRSPRPGPTSLTQPSIS